MDKDLEEHWVRIASTMTDDQIKRLTEQRLIPMHKLNLYRSSLCHINDFWQSPQPFYFY